MTWIIAIVSTVIFIFMLYFMLEHDSWFKDSDLIDILFTIIGIIVGSAAIVSLCKILG